LDLSNLATPTKQSNSFLISLLSKNSNEIQKQILWNYLIGGKNLQNISDSLQLFIKEIGKRYRHSSLKYSFLQTSDYLASKDIKWKKFLPFK
jgi:hypothetical protein